MRFGFDDKKPATLDEIGKKYHITIERVRQISAQGLKKLRYSKYIKDYSIYMQFPDKAKENIDKLRKRYAEDLKTTKEVLPVKEKDKKSKKLETKLTKSIYEYFSDFTHEQIDEMLSNLSEEEMSLLKKRYGNDLLNATMMELESDEEKTLYSTLIPKMKIILNGLYAVHKEQNVMLEGTTIINRKRHTKSKPNEKVLTLKPNK